MSDQQPPPYGQPNQPNPYQPGPSYSAYGGAPGQPPFVPQDHPQATTVLILGILSLALCQVLGPFAWVMGNRVIREIDAANGAVGGRSNANIGRILGIVGSVFLILGVLFFLAYLVIVVVAVGTSV